MGSIPRVGGQYPRACEGLCSGSISSTLRVLCSGCWLLCLEHSKRSQVTQGSRSSDKLGQGVYFRCSKRFY
ncbi:hypothetical protein B5X24_HaOG213077 [Helicoverpa armigera]|nr:hypothetical protein B5X24_HaOG213077 [Helicoverpa armigera]